MSETVYLNGSFLPLEQATIPVLDRGFIFGDGVYEVVPVYSGQPFRLDEHLARLANSLEAIRIRNPLSLAEWQGVINRLVHTNDHFSDQSVYIQITRGVAPRNQAFPPSSVAPTVFIMSMPLDTPTQALVQSGVSAITALDIRWQRCNIKAISLLANVLLRQEAVDHGVAETLMLRDGYLTEGSSSNILIVEQGKLLAPPKNEHMLPGITYDVVLELAEANGIAYSVEPISESRLRAADEVWLTSSTKEVLAIVSLDNAVVGTGKPGPLLKRMYALYQEFKKQVMRRQVPHHGQ
ncbi:D-amino acid aminotransferase [Methylobacillus arboreus]|uniref:D-amino acid aminotransferase n=1 Tax=Methylobacillus arboreus TaxID=755170 RepID=UPI001E443AA1|nr:D-amino acid aminotransferase [Methylobacillus arboreus]MCB5190712.1 D-amino acid aminotransferase [Methylobacillus arboreus]